MKLFSFITDEQGGFMLVMALMSLVVLSLLGVSALSTSIYEMNLSGNEKFYEEDLFLSESGAYAESAKVGFVTDTVNEWYQVTNPENLNTLLHPPIVSSDFDPGSDLASTPTVVDAVNEDTWPIANITGSIDPVDDALDYSYLVTYLYPDVAPKEYGTDFSAYQFRINSKKLQDIEVGGMRIGKKSTI